MHTLHNPFETIMRKLEDMEVAMDELKIQLSSLPVRSTPESKLNKSEPITRKEAAPYLGVSVGTVDNLVKSKQLKHIRYGKSVRFTYDDLDEFIKQKKVCPV